LQYQLQVDSTFLQFTADAALQSLFGKLEPRRDHAKVAATFGSSDESTFSAIEKYTFYLRKYPSKTLTIDGVKTDDSLEFGAISFMDHPYQLHDVGKNYRSMYVGGKINSRFFGKRNQYSFLFCFLLSRNCFAL
jgi:hypothetical protein